MKGVPFRKDEEIVAGTFVLCVEDCSTHVRKGKAYVVARHSEVGPVQIFHSDLLFRQACPRKAFVRIDIDALLAESESFRAALEETERLIGNIRGGANTKAVYSLLDVVRAALGKPTRLAPKPKEPEPT